MKLCLPPWNYHNLQEIEAARHDYFFRLLGDVESAIEQYASLNCLHSLAGIRNNRKINGRIPFFRGWFETSHAESITCIGLKQ